MAAEFDIVILGGMVYDGTGAPPLLADIGIDGDRIAFVGEAGSGKGRQVIDARGLAVSPGFIDTHAHSDFTLMADPSAEGKILQGITTEIEGNCGMSSAPLYDKARERREEDLKELGIRERWNTLEEYFGLLRSRGIALNIAMLAGHGNLRGSVVGYDDALPTPEESAEMARLLREAIGHGAIGLSTGLIYPPGIYSDTNELVALASVLRDPNLIYTSHMRSEGAKLEEAVGEVIRIGQEANVKVHISHIKTAGQKNWHKADRVIATLHEARNSGVRLTCDRYPYTASSTDLDSIFPSWAFAGGNEEELNRLGNSTDRERIRAELTAQAGSREYWEKIILSSVGLEKNRWMEGRTVASIAGELGMDEVDCVFQLLLEEKLRVGAIFLSMSDENLRKFLSLPFCMIGSDSSARSFSGPTRLGKPHPRTFGTFPRLLGRYVRQEHFFPLEEALRKATSLAADTFGLQGRGRISPGAYADVVVFDPGAVMDAADFADPYRGPNGIVHVLVNGIPAVSGGVSTGRRPGKILSANS